MARYRISGRALGAAFKGGLAQGFMQSRANREAAELKREELEIAKKEQENRTAILANQIQSGKAAQEVAERDLLLKTKQPNGAGFLAADLDDNNKLIMTADEFMIPKHNDNKTDVHNASATLAYLLSQSNDKVFLHSLQNNDPAVTDAMFSNLYTTATAPITAKVDGVDGLTSKEAMFISTGENSVYKNLFKVYPKFEEIVEARNAELKKVIPTDDNGEMTYINKEYTASNGQKYNLYNFVSPTNVSKDMSAEELEALNTVTKRDVFQSLNNPTNKGASAFLNLLDGFSGLSRKGNKQTKIQGAAIYLDPKNQDYLNFNNSSSQLEFLPEEEMEKLIRATFDPRITKNPKTGVYSADEQMKMVDQIIFAHALREYGGEIIENINQGNNVFKSTLRQDLHESRLSNEAIKDNDKAFQNAKGFVTNADILLENNLRIRELSREAFGEGRENIAALGQSVSGPLFDIFKKVEGVLQATGLIDNTDYFAKVLELQDNEVAKGQNEGQNVKQTINQMKEGTKFGEIIRDHNVLMNNENTTAAFRNNINEVMTLYSTNQKDNLDAYRDGAISKEIYLLRAESESLKVRMAFQAASMVQGGGAGGGRTISNNDYEAIYKSLFSAGTGEAFDRVIMLARQEMAKAMMRAKINHEYGGLGIQRELGNVSDRIMEDSFRIALKQRDPLGVGIEYSNDMTAAEKLEGLTSNRPEELGDLLINSPEDLKELGIDQAEIQAIVSDSETDKSQKAAALGEVYINKLLPQVYRLSVNRGITDTEEIKKEMLKTLTATSGNYEIIQPDGSVKVEFVAGISLRNEFANALINQFDFIAAGQQQVSDMQLNLRESQLYN